MVVDGLFPTPMILLPEIQTFVHVQALLGHRLALQVKEDRFFPCGTEASRTVPGRKDELNHYLPSRTFYWSFVDPAKWMLDVLERILVCSSLAI